VIGWRRRPLLGTALVTLALSLASAGGFAANVWSVQGAHNIVYLAGSVHLLRPGEALPPALDRAYTDSPELVMEIDLSSLDPDAGQNYVLAHGMLPSGQTLRGIIGEARYARLQSHAAQLGLPLAGLDALEPWTVAITLTQLEYAHAGLDPDSGVERQLERRAEADHKPIHGLETLEDQLGLLHGMSYEDQARFLDLSSEEGEDLDTETTEILKAWSTGDERTLERLLRADYDEFPELFQRLVTDRNRRWIPELAALLRGDRNQLVVVGALHLVGQDGVVALLRAQGYTVRALD